MGGLFDERKKGHEAKFARDMEQEFRVNARRNRLAGEWAAAKLGLTDAETEAYAKAVIQADFEEVGDADVIGKLMGDLLKAGLETSEIEVREALSRCEAEARAQIKKEV